MLNKKTLVTIFIALVACTPCSIAHADEVSDAIDEANNLAGQAEIYNRDVLMPQIEQQERYFNQLQSLCNQGDMNACEESIALLRRQNDRFDEVLQWQRQQLGY
jgi:hypothetical protein